MADFATVTELELATGAVGLGARGTALLGYASAEIRRYTGQDLEATTGRQEEHAAGAQAILQTTQTPVTAVTAITVAAVPLASTAYVWSRWGAIHLATWEVWDTGPIVITYDSGYAADSDEMIEIKGICIEVAWRALGGPAPDETFGFNGVEQRGGPFHIALTPGEEMRLDSLGLVGVG